MPSLNSLDKKCKPTEHNYQPVPTNVGVERRQTFKGTQILLGYVCTKCGDSIQRQVSFWPKRNPNPYPDPKDRIIDDDIPF